MATIPPDQLKQIQKVLAHNDTYLTKNFYESNILSIAARQFEREALELLVKGLLRGEPESKVDGVSKIDPLRFADLKVAVSIPAAFTRPSDGVGGSEKFIVAPQAISVLGKEYIVYAAGVQGNDIFEQYMSGIGADVHGFDCLANATAKHMSAPYHFHPWCIGRPASFENSAYVSYGTKSTNTNGTNSTNGGYLFFTLADIQRKLGHKHLHMLKMDIEGFEWSILTEEILSPKSNILPDQILLELHTEGANEKYVPSKVVAGKQTTEVNLLVFALWQKGYRLANIELNQSDRYCAEMTFYRVTNPHVRKSKTRGGGRGRRRR